MREILFRGKSRDTNKWVFGDFVSDACGISHEEYLNEYGDVGYIMTYVIPETVGQFTGLTDKNDKKIFEGDVFAWNDGEINIVTGKPYPDEMTVVCFDNKKSAFVSKTLNGACETVYETITDNNSRYVGNIYDNPELLKGGDENA